MTFLTYFVRQRVNENGYRIPSKVESSRRYNFIVGIWLHVCCTSALPPLILCLSSAPKSNQTRSKFELALLFYRLWFEFGSNLLRVCNGFTAEVQRRMSRETADLLLTYY